ncbi:hypothetical protein QFZ24_004458 [Streptomyces phaeochromogenes]|nr:hypothetical protein [Streptomyces phaeochromogenes]
MVGFLPVTPRCTNRARFGFSSACFTPQDWKPFWCEAHRREHRDEGTRHRGRADVLVDLALRLKLFDRVREGVVHGVQDLHTDLVEAFVAFGGAQVDDSEDGVVFAPELQEAVDEFLGGLPAGLADPGAPFEEFGQPGALRRHLLCNLQDGALDVREVLIEGRR